MGAGDFDGRDILAEIEIAGDSVGIVTLAPELDGALDLIRRLVSRGRRVSLGHSGATLAQSRAAIEAGARHATHLFNRMPPLSHREPGLAGAILTSAEVAAEIICDGVHVHRDMVRMAIAAKGAARMMAITDGVAAAGLPEGSTASLGGRTIRVRNSAAYLEDGTLAGSVATMDRVFRFLINDVGLSLNDAAQLCATTPASELGLTDMGSIIKGAIADLVVMDRDLNGEADIHRRPAGVFGDLVGWALARTRRQRPGAPLPQTREVGVAKHVAGVRCSVPWRSDQVWSSRRWPSLVFCPLTLSRRLHCLLHRRSRPLPPRASSSERRVVSCLGKLRIFFERIDPLRRS